MKSLEARRETARARVDDYTNPRKHYAFHTYDLSPLNKGMALRPEDILAANLLSLRLGWRQVIPLFADRVDADTADAEAQNAPQELLARMNEALAALQPAPPFETIESEAELEEVFAPLAMADEATRSVTGWTAVTVSKVLHRHAPHIIPIVDSRVRAFYDVRPRQESELRLRLWHDVTTNLGWLRPLASEYTTSEGRELTVLRLVDILIWTPEPATTAAPSRVK